MENQDLTKGRVLPVLLKFTIPILLSLLLQTAYGTVDLLVVGQFSAVGDASQVSGVTIGSQVMQTVTGLFAGLSMGTTILLGQALGGGQKEKTGRTVGVSILLFSLLAVVGTGFLLLCHEQIAFWMKTPDEAMVPTQSYLIVAGFGCIFIVAYNLLGSIFRGIGDSKTPLITVFIAFLVNVILDLVFVAGLKLGAMGAALATTIAQGASVVLSLVMMKRKPLPFQMVKEDWKLHGDYVKNILQLGIPVALQSVLVSVSFLAVTAIINVTFGVFASAAVGIVEKITGLVMIVPLAFTQSLSAFTAQNYGAKQLKRANEGLKYGILLSLAFGVIMAYISAFHGTVFTRLFTQDAQTTANALPYLQSYSIDVVLVAIMFAMAGYFNGCGKTQFVMVESLVGAIAIRIPLAYLLSQVEGATLFTIGLATPSSTFVQIIFCVIYYIWFQRKSNLEPQKY